MPKLSNCTNRDRKLNKRKNGMRVINRSIFLIEEIQKKKAKQIRQARKEKELLLEGE